MSKPQPTDRGVIGAGALTLPCRFLLALLILLRLLLGFVVCGIGGVVYVLLRQLADDVFAPRLRRGQLPVLLCQRLPLLAREGVITLVALVGLLVLRTT